GPARTLRNGQLAGGPRRQGHLHSACAPAGGAAAVNWVSRGLLLAAVLLASGCAGLSNSQRGQAAAIAAAARQTTLDCDRADRCAQPSPLRALGGQAMAESRAGAPRHYATILDHGEESLVARLNLIHSA